MLKPQCDHWGFFVKRNRLAVVKKMGLTLLLELNQ